MWSPQSVSTHASSSSAPSFPQHQWYRGKLLGKGNYGRVYELHDHYNQRVNGWVYKTSPFRREKDCDTFQREVWHLLDMNIRTVTPVVPHLLDYAIEPRRNSRSVPVGMQVMDRMDGTMTDRGLDRAARYHVPDGCMVHTPAEMYQMRQCINHIDSRFKVHGDLKRRNLLYSLHPDFHIRLTDFGFTGYCPGRVPWNRFLQPPPFDYPNTDSLSSQSAPLPLSGFKLDAVEYTHHLPDSILSSFWFPQMGCPIAVCHAARKMEIRLWPYVNRWQMYFDLTYNRVTYVTDTDNEQDPVCRLCRPQDVQDWLELPDSVLLAFDRMLDRNSRVMPPLPKHVPPIAYRRGVRYPIPTVPDVCWTPLSERLTTVAPMPSRARTRSVDRSRSVRRSRSLPPVRYSPIVRYRPSRRFR